MNADCGPPIAYQTVGVLLQVESNTDSRAQFSILTYLNIVLVSFGRHAGSFPVQNGSDQLSEDAVVDSARIHTRRSCAGVSYAMVMTHNREDDVTFYNMSLEHAHSSHHCHFERSKGVTDTQDFLQNHFEQNHTPN